MQAFTFATSQNIICETGAASRLAELCQQQDVQSVMIITDPGIQQLGLHLPTLEGLNQAGMYVELFTDVQADPPESVVLAAVDIARQTGVDAIIGFGGGSSLDVAKIVALLAHPQCMQQLADIYGVNNARGQRLPLYQVPTTAGTGSEVTLVAIVSTGETTKMGAVTPLFLPDFAILDADLTMGLPPQVTAATGVDAMVHAIEAYTSKLKKNPMSDLMAREALRLMSGSIQTAVHKGSDKTARENMLLGAMLAGQAFANSPVAAVHALAYPLGGHFHIPHGLSNSLVLPHVMRFNISETAGLYAELAPIIFPDEEISGGVLEVSTRLIEKIEELIRDLDLPVRLRDMDIAEDFLPKLAEDAMLQTRLLVNNRREVTYQDALEIYTAAY
ncbi:MAG: iron-containing alcohol dehydrogenase [Proteobacteria bacterium]|nr:iron-containing alcohol dehydrogenase [Pseudomonadota bacterium]